jgi:hypothetical protein
MEPDSHQWPGRIVGPDQVDWLPQVRYAQATDRGRYGRLALKIAKAGGLAFAGLAGSALGATVGQPHAGAEPLRHAAAEVIQMLEDPWG